LTTPTSLELVLLLFVDACCTHHSPFIQSNPSQPDCLYILYHIYNHHVASTTS
jgi:hypothetical protein